MTPTAADRLERAAKVYAALPIMAVEGEVVADNQVCVLLIDHALAAERARVWEAAAKECDQREAGWSALLSSMEEPDKVIAAHLVEAHNCAGALRERARQEAGG